MALIPPSREVPGNLLQTLSEPRLEATAVSLSMLRLDQLSADAPGNKLFKLLPNLRLARELGYRRVVSFGGAWSNHLHALALLGPKFGLATVGIVRGECPAVLSATLMDAQRCGMELQFISRADYRRRADEDFQADLLAELGPAWLLPEGGGNTAGAEGCRGIVECLEREAAGTYDCVAVACGTGSTLAGIAAALPPAASALGIAVVKGEGMASRIGELLESLGRASRDNWSVDTRFHGGGYARMSSALHEFIVDFYRQHRIPLEPVYTGKLMYALFAMIEEGAFAPGTRLIAIHSGGLQGLRGSPGLLAELAEMGLQGLQ